MAQISPQFMFLYNYDVEDFEDEVDVKFKIPSSFNTKGIKVVFDSKKNCVRASVAQELPFLMGKFFGPIESYTRTTSGTTFSISFSKKETGRWGPLISGFYPGTESIDPSSALRLFLINKNVEDQNAHAFAQQMLSIALDAQFLPAIQMAIEANFTENGNKEVLMQLLQVAALKYNDPLSYHRLGIMLANDPKSVVQGFQFLQKSAELGFGLSVTVMGQLLSPLSDAPFPDKNPKQALELFESVIANAEEPVSLYEAAKLYNAGVGCEQDPQKAKQYLDRARKSEPSIPELPEIKTRTKTSNIIKQIAIAGISTIAVAGFAYAVFRIFKRKN